MFVFFIIIILFSITETAESAISPKDDVTNSTADGGDGTDALPSTITNTTIESEIVAKKSVVFSVLEVCTFLVTKYAKDLVVSAGLVTGNVARKPGM